MIIVIVSGGPLQSMRNSVDGGARSVEEARHNWRQERCAHSIQFLKPATDKICGNSLWEKGKLERKERSLVDTGHNLSVLTTRDLRLRGRDSQNEGGQPGHVAWDGNSINMPEDRR